MEARALAPGRSLCLLIKSTDSGDRRKEQCRGARPTYEDADVTYWTWRRESLAIGRPSPNGKVIVTGCMAGRARDLGHGGTPASRRVVVLRCRRARRPNTTRCRPVSQVGLTLRYYAHQDLQRQNQLRKPARPSMRGWFSQPVGDEQPLPPAVAFRRARARGLEVQDRLRGFAAGRLPRSCVPSEQYAGRRAHVPNGHAPPHAPLLHPDILQHVAQRRTAPSPTDKTLCAGGGDLRVRPSV